MAGGGGGYEVREKEGGGGELGDLPDIIRLLFIVFTT